MMKKRLLTALLALALLLGLCPVALADWEDMTPSQACAEFIMEHEGFAERPYTDGTGWYIGYGCSCSKDDYPNGITRDEAEQLLRSRLDTCAEAVNTFLKGCSASVTQSQFDAMISMTYNFGSSWLSLSNRLPSYIAKGAENYSDQEIVNAFAAWCHVGGEVSTGLLSRRIAEAQMFLYGDYESGDDGWSYLILDANGGSVDSDVACFPTGERYSSLPKATKAGFRLTGWQTRDRDMITTQDKVQGNLTVTAVWEDASEYHDVPKDAWYHDYVHDLSAQGVINGYDDGTFRPLGKVTYGQALKLVLLAAGYAAQTADSGEHWAAGYRKYAVKMGFIGENDMQNLDAEISRTEVANLTAKALDLDTAQYSENPFDDKVNASVLALYGEGIILGNTENGQRLFKGADSLSRAEISAIVYRVTDYVEENIIFFYGRRIKVDHSLAANSYDSSLFYTENNRVYYGDPNCDVQYGIDVSYYQGDIDWQAVADDGIDFVIIRVGYRGCSEGNLCEDVRYREYIEGATNAGLDVGLYFFSQALNAEEAREEAQYLLERIGKYEISYPIAFDWEPLNYSYSRTKDYDYSVLTDCALAFCQTISDAGYTPMVYYNESFAYLRYDLPRVTQEITWLAHYTNLTDYRYDFKIWQYGSSGSVAGIAGRVDMDISFVNFGKN
jgi:GH25 family lysozyme M1 (1,4-beta-N-acetylmuramidase)/GH24 family phage-related lysozyme (muramidase)